MSCKIKISTFTREPYFCETCEKFFDKVDTGCSNAPQTQTTEPEETVEDLLYRFVYFVANDYVELSHEKVQSQRDEYIKKARKTLEAYHKIKG